MSQEDTITLPVKTVRSVSGNIVISEMLLSQDLGLAIQFIPRSYLYNIVVALDLWRHPQRYNTDPTTYCTIPKKVLIAFLDEWTKTTRRQNFRFGNSSLTARCEKFVSQLTGVNL